MSCFSIGREGYSCSGLADFIETLAVGAHVKDAQTGKCILCNQYEAESLGLSSPRDKVGLTAHDVFSDGGLFFKKWPFAEKKLNETIVAWKKEELERISGLEYQVKETQCPAKLWCIQILSKGFIQIEQSVKFPVLDRARKRAVAILTYASDLTPQYDFLYLFSLYRQYYSDAQAIQLLLKYLKINDHFCYLPTVKELQVLLAMYNHSNRKRTARLLNVSYHSVIAHLDTLKQAKLMKPDIEGVLIHLRKRLNATLYMPATKTPV